MYFKLEIFEVIYLFPMHKSNIQQYLKHNSIFAIYPEFIGNL